MHSRRLARFCAQILLLGDASYPLSDPPATHPAAFQVARCEEGAEPNSTQAYRQETSDHTADSFARIRTEHNYYSATGYVAMGSGRLERIPTGHQCFACGLLADGREVIWVGVRHHFLLLYQHQNVYYSISFPDRTMIFPCLSTFTLWDVLYHCKKALLRDT